MILFLYGASGAGIEVYDMIMRNSCIRNRYSSIYFIDDFQDETEYYGTRRMHFTSCLDYIENGNAEFIIAVGEPSARKFLFDRIKNSGNALTTLIDERAIVSDTAQISEGCIINAGAVISSNVLVKENCFVMFDAIIGHDAIIQNNCVICPKSTVGGHCNVGEQSFVGIGSSMIQEINIGNRVIIGMGSMVFRNVEDDMTVIGNPARTTRGNAEHKVF